MAEPPEIPAPELAEATSVETPVAAPARRSPEQIRRAERLAKALRDNLRRRKAPRAPASRPEN